MRRRRRWPRAAERARPFLGCVQTERGYVIDRTPQAIILSYTIFRRSLEAGSVPAMFPDMMPTLSRFFARAFAPVRLVLAASVSLTMVVAAQPAEAGILSHHAIYDLSLAKSRGGGAVSQAKGKLEFEWVDACTGWTVAQRTRVELVSAEGRVVVFGWSLNSHESRDGLNYRFSIRRLNADKSTEEVRGEAQLDGPGEGGIAVYDEPAPQRIALPRGTVFPTAHSLALIEAAHKGESPLWRIVFDGSGDEGLFGVSAAISPLSAASGQDRPLLKGQESWRVDLAYFGLDTIAAEPEHEQRLRLYANGVVDELLLDYGDFVLRADLAELEGLPELECPPD